MWTKIKMNSFYRNQKQEFKILEGFQILEGEN